MNKHIFRGWLVVAACFFCLMVAAGIGWFSFPVFIKPIENELGWSRTRIMGAIGLFAFGMGVFSPILGHLIDRMGARRVMLGGVLVGVIVCLALAEIRSIMHLYVVLFFASLGTTASTYMPVATVVSRWFVRRRGLAMSIAMMGMGVGGFIMPNASNLLIELVGWRWAYRLLGIALGVLVIPVVALFVHGSPSDVGQRPDGDEETANTSDASTGGDDSTEGFSARQALRMPRFWGIGIADLTAAIGIVGIENQMVAFSIDAGIDDTVAAFAFSLIRGVMVLGMMLTTAHPTITQIRKMTILKEVIVIQWQMFIVEMPANVKETFKALPKV